MLEIRPNDVLKCRTIWISDVHLGSKYCKAKQLLEFLDRIEFDQLYLVGDIVDLLAMRGEFTGQRLITGSSAAL